jgi:starch-binding outer membrane protein, SusD/RagB family
MKTYRKNITITILFSIMVVVLFSSCKEFLNPEQEINITEDRLYDDWYEYRSVEMGLYALQQKLVEQLVVLGELRGDLLTITDNADADLVEIYNFNISKDNKYASPTNFFKLISACNRFIRTLQREQPDVMDMKSPINNYDRLYGEALCMRAWAYFNAVRIYGKVPFIPESLTSTKEINEYLSSSGTYIDSIDIVFDKDGYHNDTIYNKPIALEKQYYNQSLIIDYFTNELENKVKAVGVNHYIENNDQTWEVTIWNIHAMNTLLGLMYLTVGDLAKAAGYFEKIVYLPSDDNRYQLDNSFSNNKWRNIFNSIDLSEHIFSVWFNKSYLQQNNFQQLFEPNSPHQYMLKPSRPAILKWETIWDDFKLFTSNAQPWTSKTLIKGRPGDFHRGHGVSFAYLRNGEPLLDTIVQRMLLLKSENDYRSANLLVENVDTVVWKYSWNKNIYDKDANYTLYRAAGVHLWLAEVYTFWAFERDGLVRTFTTNALNIVNDGTNYSLRGNRPQMGVRGRVGFGGSNDGIKVDNIIYERDPFTNNIIDYIDLSGDFLGKQHHLENEIIEERARELAFEGERFYDLMRVAKRRNDPSFLAERVAKKYHPDRREEIYNLLLNEENWYINYFE